ncbi:hypothetical protein CIRG_02264 [Coccidioides immitis RMSCC 2394]|uniref:Uncharacterized protein n=1 Tax=Coccidioides immitis RMSCC 2394 TaxID=404692 RepID=A0A0J7AYP0_COCIT|nr:hypothetical protein CIRG_02264 [Coccidioides immitis RMSCC 2394]
MSCIKSFLCVHLFCIAGEEWHKTALKEWALKKNIIKEICYFQSSTELILSVILFHAMTRLNYFGPINVSDHPAPAAPASAVIIHHLYSASILPTTSVTAPSPPPSPTTISLPPPGADRISTYQMADIRALVWFIKLILEKQKKKEEKKKKKKKKRRKKKKKREKKKEKENNNDENNDDNENDNNNNNNELVI